MSVNIAELDKKLFHMTESETYHQQHPGQLSERYGMIPFSMENNEKIYDFSFNSLMKDRFISITKESRFTSIPKHRHKVIELSYVYSGTCRQIIEGEEVILHKGDVCLLDRNVCHEVLQIGENDIIITIDMRKQYLVDVLLARISSQGIVSQFLANAVRDNTTSRQFVVLRNNDDEDLRRSFQEIMCEYWSDNISNEVIDAYMTIIISRLLRILRSNSMSEFHRQDSTLILEILQHIDINYLNVTLSDLSDRFGYNSNYISNYIRQQTGKTFKQLVIQKRMSAAAYALANTDIPVYEIAEDIGYNNLGFFYDKFRSYYGMNPQGYRSMMLHPNQL